MAYSDITDVRLARLSAARRIGCVIGDIVRFIWLMVLTTILIAACGGGGGPESAGQAAKRQYEMLGRQQYSRVYDELHPGLQAIISRDDWVAKQQAKNLRVIGEIRLVESHDEPFAFPDGTRIVTAVTLGIKTNATSVPAGFFRGVVVHEELINGKWRLFAQ